MKLQRLFQSWKNLKSEETEKKKKSIRRKKMVFWSFICKEKPGFVPLKQTFLTLQIQKNSLWPKATLHTLIF